MTDIAWRLGTFAAVALAVTLLALDGGAFDLVVRQRFALVLWWVLALAALAGLAPRTRLTGGGLLVLGALLGLGAWTAASFGWTSSDERTLTELARVAAHLGVVVAVACVVRRRAADAAIAGAATAAVAVCAIALVARLHPGFLGTTSVVADAFGARRLSAPLNYWNAVGTWGAMTIGLCLGMGAHARAPAWRAAAAAAVPLAAGVAYMTYSRAAIAGVVVALLALVIASRNRWTLAAHTAVGGAASVAVILVIRGHHEIADGTGSAGAGAVLGCLAVAAAISAVAAIATGRLRCDELRMSARSGRVGAAVAVLAAVVAVAVAGAADGDRAWHEFRDTKTSSLAVDPAARLTNLNGKRYLSYSVALHAFAAHPLDGTGAGTFEFTWDRAARDSEQQVDAHSLYVESLSELGVFGLLCVLALLAGTLWSLVVTLRAAGAGPMRGPLVGASGALAAYAVEAGVDWMWECTAVTMLGLVLVAAVVLTGGRRRLRPARAPARVAFALAALVVCAIELPGLVSTSELRKSQAAAGRGDLPAALARASTAVEAEPWAASPYLQRALVSEQAGRWLGALTDLRRAASREPRNWRIALVDARVEAEAGHTTAALAAYRRARELRPLGTYFVHP